MGETFMTRRQFLVCSTALFGCSLVRKVNADNNASDVPTPPIGQRQLFLDDACIERVERLQCVVNQPKKHSQNPVVRPDKPWESRCQVYGTALFDEECGMFRLWYLTTPRDRGAKPLKLNEHERAPHTTLCAYAESEDGIHWRKPNLGQFPYDGDRNNNLIDIGRWNCEGISVLYDPHDANPKHRWKAVYWDHGSGGWEMRDGRPYCKPGPHDGFCVAFSSDGIHWIPYEGNPVIRRYCDTNQNVIYDERLGKYVAFSRFGFGRKLARSESEDFIHWTEPQLVLQCDTADGPGTQIYGAGVDIYEGLYVAMIWIYREQIDGKIDTQLAVSRDGIHWTRVGNRATWLPLGDDDSWEGGMVRSCERIIIRNDELYIYYCGVHGPHPGPKFRQIVRKYPTAIGLAIQRRDGFVSLDADGEGGWMLTKPLRLPTVQAYDLHVNADASHGELRVALCDANGIPLKGFERSLPITGDQHDARVIWTNRITKHRGAIVRLRFTLRSAKLYSYWFA